MKKQLNVLNPENIPQFRPNGPIYKSMEKICSKYNIYPTVQIFRARRNMDYRGLTLVNRITLYWSNIETNKSMLWVFCHELRHCMIEKNPQIFRTLEETELAVAEFMKKKKISKLSVRSTYRILYDIGIMEAICDLFATEEVGKDYGVAWYSRRLKTEKGEKNVSSN